MQVRRIENKFYQINFENLDGCWLIKTHPFSIFRSSDKVGSADISHLSLKDGDQQGEDEDLVKPTSYIQPLLILSTNCNLQCHYCYASAGSYGVKQENMPKEVVEYSLNFLERQLKAFKKSNPLCEELQVGIICFGGEPFLNFVEILPHRLRWGAKSLI